MKIPATVITGFLGAGKTTLLRHLIAHSGRRLALIINEFGDLGVDREIVLGCGVEGCREDDVIELANGCICCTVADDFLPTIARLVERPDPPDHIVIETSGLALPKPLVKAFGWPEVRARTTVDGVIAVIDGPAVLAGRFADDPRAVAAARAGDPALDHDSPLAELFEDQVRCADLVILNKVDRLTPAERAQVEAQVAATALRRVPILAAAFGVLPAAVVLGVGAAAEDDADNRPSHHDHEDDHGHDDFASFVVEVPELADPQGFERALAAAAAEHDLLRIKGLLAVAGKPMRHVLQAAGARIEHYYDRPWRTDEARLGRLVVIAEAHVDRAAVTAAIAAGARARVPAGAA